MNNQFAKSLVPPAAMFAACVYCCLCLLLPLLPVRASEQGNVIGSVRIYIYICVCTKKIVIERTRDLIYLKFVATDFFLKIVSPSAGEYSGDLA